MLWPVLQLCFLIAAQPSPVLPTNTLDAGKPVVNWTTEQEHDFGVMEQGRPKVFVFQFLNISPDTILLQTVRTSCGCTAANWTETPVAPGGGGEVRIEYDAYQTGTSIKKSGCFLTGSGSRRF